MSCWRVWGAVPSRVLLRPPPIITTGNMLHQSPAGDVAKTTSKNKNFNKIPRFDAIPVLLLALMSNAACPIYQPQEPRNQMS